ncbi:MAG: hypothetical protein KME59_23655 [Trichormus sp. ATA11-4-KO1]|nr:hypothetical protein [Trichormus sp. ATA11-4-KO1]
MLRNYKIGDVYQLIPNLTQTYQINPLALVIESSATPLATKRRTSTLSTQHSALSTPHSALPTQHSALSTQHSTLSTQHSIKAQLALDKGKG